MFDMIGEAHICVREDREVQDLICAVNASHYQIICAEKEEDFFSDSREGKTSQVTYVTMVP